MLAIAGGIVIAVVVLNVFGGLLGLALEMFTDDHGGEEHIGCFFLTASVLVLLLVWVLRVLFL